MLIWINGAFGAGKTSVAELLDQRIGQSRIYDPERVGYFLNGMVPDSGTDDFQDLPIWRTLVADVALALNRHYDDVLITPMTVVNPAYFKEIAEPLVAAGVDLRPFALEVSPELLRQRITAQVLIPDDAEQDEQTRKWRLDRVDSCAAALSGGQLGELIDNNGRSLGDVVDDVIERLSR